MRFNLLLQRTASPVARAKFLSKIFGFFSEEIVSLWARDDRAPYENLGRPTIKTLGNNRGHTLDFTLRQRSSGNIYVAEMKCEIEYQNFKYFVLEKVEQLEHYKKPAFDAFLKSARYSSDQTVHAGGKGINTHGAILIWGSVTTSREITQENRISSNGLGSPLIGGLESIDRPVLFLTQRDCPPINNLDKLSLTFIAKQESRIQP